MKVVFYEYQASSKKPWNHHIRFLQLYMYKDGPVFFHVITVKDHPLLITSEQSFGIRVWTSTLSVWFNFVSSALFKQIEAWSSMIENTCLGKLPRWPPSELIFTIRTFSHHFNLHIWIWLQICRKGILMVSEVFVVLVFF